MNLTIDYFLFFFSIYIEQKPNKYGIYNNNNK